MADPQLEALIAAKDKAQRLVESLRKERDALAANPPALEPDQLAQGREAMDNALAAAERMLNNLESATKLGFESHFDDTAANN